METFFCDKSRRIEIPMKASFIPKNGANALNFGMKRGFFFEILLFYRQIYSEKRYIDIKIRNR